ncbi:YggU family protein [Methanofollis formosanus]|uniref:UPF0235 protein E2N92_12955 n=1 Tax=Methanofollis formosanus TaxID=299308 RepID=A0A8G1A331_9EURY|nr:DUF167 domain-containing protein [Methanofollis formosanus]QYZ80272.1 YggU family protein [Methanofollis formosanus]
MVVLVDSFGDAVLSSDNGAVITIDVSAGCKKDAFPAGYNPWRKAVVCHVAARAVGGKANRAILDLIAGTFGVPKSSVSIISGAISSTKKIEIAGISREDAVSRLSVLLKA